MDAPPAAGRGEVTLRLCQTTHKPGWAPGSGAHRAREAELTFRLCNSCRSGLVSLEESGNVAFIWASPLRRFLKVLSGSSSKAATAPFSPFSQEAVAGSDKGRCWRADGLVCCALMSPWPVDVCVLPVTAVLGSGIAPRVKSQDIMARSQSLQLFCFWHCHYGIMGF